MKRVNWRRVWRTIELHAYRANEWHGAVDHCCRRIIRRAVEAELKRKGVKP